MTDVRRMLDAAPTRRNQVSQPQLSAEAVYRGAIVLVCAAWEAFLEDLALEALKRVVMRQAKGGSLTALGQEVANRASHRAQRDAIAWVDSQSLLRRRDVFLGVFNTPKSSQVDGLFARTLDLERLSSSWVWGSVKAPGAARQLDALVSLRGDIAHRAKSLGPVRKVKVQESVSLIERLGILSCNRVRHWLQDATSEVPANWDVIPVSAAA